MKQLTEEIGNMSDNAVYMQSQPLKDSKPKNTPMLKHSSVINVQAKEFKEAITYLYRAGFERVELKIVANKLNLTAQHDISDVNIRLPTLENGQPEHGGDYSYFGVEYLYTWLKQFKAKEIKDKEIKLFIDSGEEYNKGCFPLRAELNQEFLILAPRMSMEE